MKSNMNTIADRDPDWVKVSMKRSNSERDRSNNSDASASCSIGSNSFAFNFDAVHLATELLPMLQLADASELLLDRKSTRLNSSHVD